VRVTACVSVPYTTQYLVEELAERDKSEKNFVIYNLPESKDREADKLSVLSLVKTVYDLDAQINRVVCLGRRTENKHRPLLVRVELVEDKNIVVSLSYLLHHHD